VELGTSTQEILLRSTYARYMRPISICKSYLYMTPITIVDGHDPESHKDAFIERLYAAYQDLTQSVSAFSMIVPEEAHITRSSPRFRGWLSATRVVEIIRASRREYDQESDSFSSRRSRSFRGLLDVCIRGERRTSLPARYRDRLCELHDLSGAECVQGSNAGGLHRMVG